jgi:hypothetical protein
MTARPESASAKPAPESPAPDPATELPLAVTHAAMNAAYDNGQAVPLTASLTWLTRYQDSWWVVYERGWLRVTDTATAEDLDQAAARLTEAHGLAGPQDREAGPWTAP